MEEFNDVIKNSGNGLYKKHHQLAELTDRSSPVLNFVGGSGASRDFFAHSKSTANDRRDDPEPDRA